MASKAIPSSAAKKIAAILANATDAKCFALESEFRGVEMTRKQLAKAIEWHREIKLGKLRVDDAGVYHFRVHSNCWYEFRSEAA